jgi:hypothetical protein
LIIQTLNHASKAIEVAVSIANHKPNPPAVAHQAQRSPRPRPYRTIAQWRAHFPAIDAPVIA